MPYPIEYPAEDSQYLSPPSGPPRVVSLDLELISAGFAKLFIGPCLTHLSLKYMDPWLRIEEMLTILESVPLLVHLELDCALDSTACQTEKVVRLPALQRLILDEDDSEGSPSATLLQFLRLPPHTSISIALGIRPSSSQDDQLFTQAMRSVTSNIFHAQNPLRTCRVRKEWPSPRHDPELKIDLWNTVRSGPALLNVPDKLGDEGRTTVTTSIHPFLSDQALCDVVLAALTLPDLSVLALQFYPKSPGDIWERFAQLSNVTHLVASPHLLASALLQTLVPIAGAAYNLDSSSSPLFPKLESVTLGDGRWDEELSDRNGTGVPLSKLCRDALQARLTQGVPLRSLAVRGATGIDEAALMVLQDSGLVGQVDCSSCGDRVDAVDEASGVS
ncbi:hypothetical protein PsYK624_090360 [Phanerochaete sordida]|uniref:Uncharacterized protein n=1 Tax=Phanerochaete sordida TaxID=48140 RepID=A0A9P3LFN7_9APHY|nr:hypothetical protein PsYK624_090360 [Phanerochaete sordida]